MILTPEQARTKYGHRYDTYLKFRNVGDPLADAVVQALDGATSQDAHVVIRKAIHDGPSAIADAPKALQNYIQSALDIPYWADFNCMESGTELFTRNAALVPLIVSSMALPHGYSTESAITLYATSVMAGYATKRLRETNRQIFEVGKKDGLKPYADGWKVCLQVRLIHAIIRFQIAQQPTWNFERYGSPLHNVHLSMLTSVMGSYIIEGLRILKRPMTETEMDGYTTIWKYAGYLMGVDPELLTSSHSEGMRHLGLIFDCELDPSKESVSLITELFNCVGPVGEISDPKQAEMVTKITLSLSREFIGDELANKLNFPKGHPAFTHSALIALLDSEKFISHFGHLEHSLDVLQVKMLQNLCLFSTDEAMDVFPLPSKIGDA